MKRAQVTEAEAATLVQIVYEIMADMDWPKTAGGGWRGGATGTRDFGGREIRISFCDPLERANPLVYIYGQQRQPGVYDHEWAIRFRVPKDFPAHPRLSANFDRSAAAIAKGTNIFDVEFKGDPSAYDRDIVFIKMTL